MLAWLALSDLRHEMAADNDNRPEMWAAPVRAGGTTCLLQLPTKQIMSPPCPTSPSKLGKTPIRVSPLAFVATGWGGEGGNLYNTISQEGGLDSYPSPPQAFPPPKKTRSKLRS